MNSKQRAYLKGLAMKLEPIANIGKKGITDSLIAEIDSVLEARELVKISVLQNADFKAKQVIEEIAKATAAEPVQAIGNKIVLFRVSKKDDIEHIVLPN